MKMFSKNVLVAMVAAAAIGSFSSLSQANVIVNLTNPGASTVNVGDTIVVRISLSTDNAFGIGLASVRVTPSTASIGGAVMSSPYIVTDLPTDSTNTTSAQAVQMTFNPLITGTGITNSPSTSTFSVSQGGTFVANSSVGERPIASFNGDNGSSRGPTEFFSAGNATQTQFVDVPFKALSAGTVFFGASLNPGTVQEYSAATGFTKNTALVAGSTLNFTGGFQVTINATGSTPTAKLGSAAVGTPLGTVVITGSNGVYTVVPSTGLIINGGTGAASGSVALNDIGAETVVDVLLASNKTAAQLNAASVDFGGAVASDVPDFFHQLYPWANVLVKYSNIASPTGAENNFFNFDLSSLGGLVTEIAAVPEPTSLGLLGIGAMALLSRRRRKTA